MTTEPTNDPLVGRVVEREGGDWEATIIAALPDGYYLLEMRDGCQVILHLRDLVAEPTDILAGCRMFSSLEAQNAWYEKAASDAKQREFDIKQRTSA